MGCYQRQHYFGGHELTEVPLSQLSEQISYVSQDNYLFNRSIRENIRMGKPGASDQEVEKAAIRSGCDSFIRGLDKGYETIVGSSGSQLPAVNASELLLPALC